MLFGRARGAHAVNFEDVRDVAVAKTPRRALELGGLATIQFVRVAALAANDVVVVRATGGFQRPEIFAALQRVPADNAHARKILHATIDGHEVGGTGERTMNLLDAHRRAGVGKSAQHRPSRFRESQPGGAKTLKRTGNARSGTCSNVRGRAGGGIHTGCTGICTGICTGAHAGTRAATTSGTAMFGGFLAHVVQPRKEHQTALLDNPAAGA
jgi:hypothetical protein